MTKFHAAFGSLFSDIVINRQSSDGSINQQIKVPLHWGEKEKMLARLEALPDADRPVALQLPIISYEFLKPTYSSDRKYESVTRNVRKTPDDKNKYLVQYSGAPYDLHYNVYVYTKSIEDGNKIVEQILPFFTPDFTISMELIPEMSDVRDIPVILNDVSYDDLGKESNPIERRILIWTLQFTMNAHFFGPVKRKPMIKDIFIRYRLDGRLVSPEDKEFPNFANTVDLENNAPVVSITEQYPGVNANGEPTANASDAIDWKLVDVDDHFAIVIERINITPSNVVMSNTSSLPLSNT